MNDIFQAISSNVLQAVSQLIEREPEVARARNQNGVSALMQSVYENKPEVTRLLRAAAGELDLYEASAVGDVGRLHTLLGSDASQVNSRSSDGFTPLHLACFFRRPEAAQLLLAAGADANAVSSHGIAVIHSAAASQEVSVVRLVLAAGANPNVQQPGGYTPLHSAAMNKTPEMVTVLLAVGADRSAKSDEGLTAADMAAKAGAQEIVALLR
jgi:uncharacterized protein